MPRVLFVTRNLPRRDNGGADLRATLVVSALAKRGPTAVYGLHAETERPAPVAEVAAWETSSVAGLTSATAGTPHALEWVRVANGHPSDAWFAEQAVESLDDLAERFAPDVAIVDHLWLHRYLAVVRRWGIPVVLNTHNVEGLLQVELAERHGAALPRLLGARTRAIEEAAVCAVDQLWVCSRDDASTFSELYGGAAPSAVVPNAVDVPTYPAAPAGNRRVVFPGVFAYPPNAAAALFLIDGVLPLLPDVQLTIVGRGPPPRLRDAAERSGRVEVTGAVEDVRPYLARASAMAVPLFDGGGTRFKLLEAFASRVPVVVTRKGVEGIDAEDGTHVLLAESAAEFAAQLDRLHADPDLRETLVDNAYRLVDRRYSLTAAETAVGSALAGLFELRAEPEEQRLAGGRADQLHADG